MGHILSALPFALIALLLLALGCALWLCLTIPCAIWLVIALSRAQWGWEDSGGFHRGRHP